MKKRIVSILLLAMMLCALAAPAFAATYATVFGGWLRLRSNPSYDASVITSYKNGSVVTVLSQENGWARVLTSDYRIGYMDARYLAISGTPAETPKPTAQPVTRTWVDVNRIAYVTSANGKGVRMRSAPVVNSSNVLGLYPVGRTAMEIRRSSDGWSYIQIDKKYGYMMSQYLTTGMGPVYPPVYTPVPTLIPPIGTATMMPTPVPTATPTPVPTATPTPAPTTIDIQSVRLDPYQPTVGDTVKLIVTPANAEYTAVWYSDEKKLLSTNKQYTVSAADAGHVIYVRVTGGGASAGFVADAATAAVKAASAALSPDAVAPLESWVEELVTLP